jgi:hypothetical protein
MYATNYGVPTDPVKAAALLARNQERVAELWRAHGIARRLTDRCRIAEVAQRLEAEIKALQAVLTPRTDVRAGAHASGNAAAVTPALLSAYTDGKCHAPATRVPPVCYAGATRETQQEPTGNPARTQGKPSGFPGFATTREKGR